jgi:hypothetical protein
MRVSVRTYLRPSHAVEWIVLLTRALMRREGEEGLTERLGFARRDNSLSVRRAQARLGVGRTGLQTDFLSYFLAHNTTGEG